MRGGGGGLNKNSLTFAAQSSPKYRHNVKPLKTLMLLL